MHHNFCRATLLWCGLLLGASALACETGSVTIDRNGDGLAQSGEPGLAGVRVSNGVEIVSTDAHGRWHGLPRRAGPVFLIKPAGYSPVAGGDGLPAFWADAGDTGCRFLLAPVAAREAGLKVIVASDPQAGNLREVGYYAQAVSRSMAVHDDAALGLTLGDIANDDLALYPQLKQAAASLGVPWLHVPGNHDLDADAGDDAGSLRTYQRHFGPDTYAWEEAAAVFVMLDNVIAMPGERPAYVGGLREDQFDFLERYLAGLDRSRLLVVAAHIPWFDIASEGRPPTIRAGDRARLFALLEPFPNVLLLSGHRHAQRRVLHDAASGWQGAAPLPEYNIGALSGAFWSGMDDADGIPGSTMSDGTPRGFATLHIDPAGGYRFAWHPTVAGEDDPAVTDAMALHAPRVLRSGAYPAWGVYANVFLGHEGTRVEYRIAGGEWTAMTRVESPDPRLVLENARDDLADSLRSYDRSPEAEPVPHLWRGALATRLPPGEYRVEVRAFDDDGREHRAALHYRLADGERVQGR